ncbi:MAG: hypothetical protein QM736_27215 [Vicinamibacterales bacterium]
MRNGATTARERDRQFELAWNTRIARRDERDERRGEHVAENDDDAGHDEERVDDVVAEAPRVLFPVQREVARERRHECRAHCSFSEEIPYEIGDAEGDVERIHRVARAEERGEHLVANESEDAAGEGGDAGEAGRVCEAFGRL